MSPPASDDTRDKVIRLESQVEHLTEAVEALNASVATLNSLLDRARGAQWVLLGVAALMGAIGGKLATWFGFLPK